MQLTGQQMQQATGGSWRYGVPAVVSSISTDTRSFTEGECFLALRGPKFDGHVHAEPVAGRAQALIGDAQGAALWTPFDVPQLIVEDTLVALGQLAHAWRKDLPATLVIAITGSYGKTTVRDTLRHVLSRAGLKVHATQANLNNLVGVPKTLMAVSADADVALIECGISECGEMEKLAAIVEPDVAVMTGLTSAHAQGLGGLRGVAQEKMKLFDTLTPHGWVALGQGVTGQLAAIGIKAAKLDETATVDMADAPIKGVLHGCTLKLDDGLDEATVALALPAPHWASNMAFVMAIANKVLMQHFPQNKNTSITQMAQWLADWQPVKGRMQSKKYDHLTVLDDSYNANPVSMQAALDTLNALDGYRIAVIGDMAELGDDAIDAHINLNVGSVEQVILVGSNMRHLHQKLTVQKQPCCWYANTETLLADMTRLQTSWPEAATVLLKASRIMHLDLLLESLREQETCDAV